MKNNSSKWLIGLAGGLAACTMVSAARRRRFDFKDKVVVITGGSRGLGLVLARSFAAEGARVAICARDEAELARAEADLRERGAQVFAGRCDVRNQNDIHKFAAEIRRRFGSADVLVNNAGIIQVGPLESQKQDDFAAALAVHFWGPLFMMQEFIPEMRARGGGRIVNISSIGGKIAVPHLTPYCASKFALAGLSSAMNAELAKDSICVTTVYPGLMRTGSHINATFKGQNEKEFALFSLTDATPVSSMDVRRAAAKIIRACRGGDAELIIGIQAKLAAKANSLAPELVASLLAMTAKMLPTADGGVGTGEARGLDSTSAMSPSIFTSLIDRASMENNELRPNEHLA